MPIAHSRRNFIGERKRARGKSTDLFEPDKTRFGQGQTVHSEIEVQSWG